jgi:hypothetical protein
MPLTFATTDSKFSKVGKETFCTVNTDAHVGSPRPTFGEKLRCDDIWVVKFAFANRLLVFAHVLGAQPASTLSTRLVRSPQQMRAEAFVDQHRNSRTTVLSSQDHPASYLPDRRASCNMSIYRNVIGTANLSLPFLQEMT